MDVCGQCSQGGSCGRQTGVAGPVSGAELLRNSMILALFCAVAIGAIAIVNRFTAPVIRRNEAALQQALTNKASQEKLMQRFVTAPASLEKPGE